ncbi:MAG: nuclear transport factor 2 family protein [Oceanicaulis sp.]
MARSPKQTVRAWVEAFNSGDAERVAAFYHEDAVNHQVAYGPIEGRAAIRAMFETEFSRAEMVCEIENLFEDGDWAILEWTDPLGLRGCGFFKIEDGRIRLQRGYFDKLSFFRAQGLPLEDALKAGV